jgi:hypothetical protein
MYLFSLFLLLTYLFLQLCTGCHVPVAVSLARYPVLDTDGSCPVTGSSVPVAVDYVSIAEVSVPVAGGSTSAAGGSASS